MMRAAIIAAAAALSSCAVPGDQPRLALDPPAPVIIEAAASCAAASQTDELRKELALLRNRNLRLEKLVEILRTRSATRLASN